MYRKILVALENSRADKSLLPHVMELAKRLGSRLLLVHVADGWVARNFEQLKLAESEEMKSDRGYLEKTVAHLRAEGLEVSAHLALGDPPTEIIKTAQREQCDLDEWARVFDKRFVRQETVVADPVARDEMLDVRDIAQRLQIDRPLVGLVLETDELDHVTALARHRGADSRFAAGGSFFHVG